MRPRCHFQKIGTLIDFKLGTVLGINAIYNRDNSPLLARGANGPYFKTDAQDPQAIQPVVKRQLHVIRSSYPNTPSPLHQLTRSRWELSRGSPWRLFFSTRLWWKKFPPFCPKIFGKK